MSKIIVRIFGGLGNQLFCYAAARRMSVVNNIELVLDDISGFTFDITYNRKSAIDNFNITSRKANYIERFEPFSRIRRHLKKKLNQHKHFMQRTYLFQETIDFDSRLLFFKPKGTVYLEGYWQSENYFQDIERLIRYDLRIIPPTDEVNKSIAKRIKSFPGAVAVHVRFFDDNNINSLHNVSDNYYSKAIEIMESIAPGAHYFIFSDQPAFARSRIPLPEHRTTLVTNNQGDNCAYADLWLMSQCQHFIIANSTFSWWGAWLALHPDKKIIAPGFEIRHGKAWWGFKGLLPDHWIKI